jgi:hypothetical protein
LVVLGGLALFFGNLALANLIPRNDKVKED